MLQRDQQARVHAIERRQSHTACDERAHVGGGSIARGASATGDTAPVARDISRRRLTAHGCGVRSVLCRGSSGPREHCALRDATCFVCLDRSYRIDTRSYATSTHPCPCGWSVRVYTLLDASVIHILQLPTRF